MRSADSRCSHVDLEICLVGSIRRDCDGWDHNVAGLIPVEPKYYGVSYHMTHSRKRECSPKCEHSVWIEALGCYALCENYGTPYIGYDGEAMKNLFLEDSDLG